MAKDIQTNINKLRQLFDTIQAGTPEAVYALERISLALDILASSGALTLSARQFRGFVEDLVKSSGIGENQVNKFANRISRSFGDIYRAINNVSAQGLFKGFTGQLKNAENEYQQFLSTNKALFDPLINLIPDSTNLQILRDRVVRTPIRYSPSTGSQLNVFRTFFNKDPSLGITPFFKIIQDSPRDLESVARQLNLINEHFTRLSGKASTSAEELRKVNSVLQATATYVNSFRNIDIPLSKFHQQIKNLALPDVRGLNLPEFFSRIIGIEEAEKTAKRIEKVAKEYGFSLEDIRSINREATTGITRIGFSRETPLQGIGAIDDEVFALENLNLTLSKTGEIISDTQKRFRTFSSAIVRDIGEVIKWAIAVSVVYAPMRKLQELIDEMIKNQAALAEIQIITGQSADEVYKSFSRITSIASTTGNNVLDTVQSYKMAYVAAGDIRDSNLRAATASKLLSDSLVLSRLSSLSAVESMDILSAALKQLGMDLSQGSVLLDKWVAVSRQANVDISTLATSFAIISSAGENVGLTIDQMNGIIAATAEVSKMSAKETGNMIRAFISGYQTESAVTELAKLGIATRDSQGSLIGFMEVFTEIKRLSEEGLISESQMARISEILGGGARRGAQLAAFIQNLNRIDEIAAVSGLAETGSAMQALQTRMETVDATSNTLRVSFSNLAQALGQEGGILSAIINLNRFLTGLTDSLTTLTHLLGTSMPTLIMAASALAFLGSNKAAAFNLQKFLGIAGYKVGSGLGRTLFGLGATGLGRETFYAASLATNKFFSENVPVPRYQDLQSLEGTLAVATVSGKTAAGETLGARFANYLEKNYRWVLPAAFVFQSAISSALEKDFLKAGATLSGAFIGGMAGNKLTSVFGQAAGPIGMLIGTAIFNSLLNAARNSADLESAFAERMLGLGYNLPKQEQAVNELIKRRDQIRKELEASAAKQTSLLGKRVAESFEPLGIEAKGIFQSIFNLSNTIKYTFYDLFNDTKGISYDRFALEMAMAFADPAIVKEYEELNNTILNYNKATQEGIVTDVKSTVYSVAELYKKDADEFITQQKRKLFEEVGEGITPSAFKEKTEALSGIALKTAQFFTEVGDKFAELINKSDDLSGAYIDLADILLTISPQENISLVGYLGSLDILKEKYGENSEEVKNLKNELASLLVLLYKQQQIKTFQMPALEMGPYTEREAELITQRARELTKELYSQLLPDTSLLPEFLGKLTPIAVEVAEEAGEKAGKRFWKKYTEIEKSQFDAAKKELEELGLIGKKDINIQPYMDLTKGEFQSRIVPLIKEFERIIGEAFYGGTENVPREPLGLIFKDGTDKIVVNLLALRLAMDKANELLQKQLDGIFNLPEGAELWVPAQAAELALQTMQAMQSSKTGELPVPVNTDKVDRSFGLLADKANEASLALQSITTIMDWTGVNKVKPIIEAGKDIEELFEKGMRERELITRNLRGVAGVREVDEKLVQDSERRSRRRYTGRGPYPLPEGYTPPRIEDEKMRFSEVIQLISKSLTDAVLILANNLGGLFTRDKVIPQRIETTSPRSIFIPTSNVQPVSKVDLTINTTSQVVLDGRMIALALKRYLARDLRVAAGGRTSTNNFFV